VTIALTCLGLYSFSTIVVLSLLRVSGRSDERIHALFDEARRAPIQREAHQELAA